MFASHNSFVCLRPSAVQKISCNFPVPQSLANMLIDCELVVCVFRFRFLSASTWFASLDLAFACMAKFTWGVLVEI